MKKLCVILLIFTFLFAGCQSSMPTDLFAVPEMSEMHRALLDTVENVCAEGFEYAEPRSGFNRQPLQIMDLDGDGEEEGIAFLRDVRDTYKTAIYVFENSNSAFSVFDVIESDEREIYTVSYSDLLGSGYEIIVEWGTQGDGAHPITAYTLERDGVEKVFDISAKQYSVNDFDGDGENELIAVTKTDNHFFADIYKRAGTKINKAASVPLSSGEGKVFRIMSGKITSDKMGAIIERKIGDGIMTDLIVTLDGEYKNLFGGGEFCSVSASSADADSDGIIEIPKTAQTADDDTGTDRTYLWNAVQDDGMLIPEVFTYHSFSKNWYISMPLAWSASVTAEVGEVSTRQTEIRFVTREETAGGDEEFVEAPLFTVYALTGDMRETLAQREGTFVISKRDDVIFTAEILSPSYLGTEITEEFIKTAFKNRESEWASEILFA